MNVGGRIADHRAALERRETRLHNASTNAVDFG